jgi:hypothetical protein
VSSIHRRMKINTLVASMMTNEIAGRSRRTPPSRQRHRSRTTNRAVASKRGALVLKSAAWVVFYWVEAQYMGEEALVSVGRWIRS